MKTRSALGWLWLVACAPEETVLRLGTLDPTECQARCISAVTVSLDGVASEHTCGAPIEVGPLVEGRTHQVVITATGAYGLNAAMEVRPERALGELTFKLEPTVRPQIEAVKIVDERQAIYGPTRLAIEVRNFSPEHPTARVRLGEMVLPVLEQAEAHVEVEIEQKGSFVLEQCGVTSEVSNFAAKGVKQDKFTIVVPDCESPRYLSASPFNNDPTRMLVAYGCGVQCNRTQLMELSATATIAPRPVAEVDGCPIDVAISAPDLVWVSTETGLHVCTGAPGLTCALRSSAGRYQQLSRADDDKVAGIYLAEGETQTSLRFEVYPGGSQAIAPSRIDAVAAIDGRMALVKMGQPGAGLFQWEADAFTFPFPLQANLQECTSPRFLRRYRNQNNAPKILVVCGDDGNLTVMRFEVQMELNVEPVLAKLRDFPVVAPVPYDLDVDPTGRVLWLWSPGQLTFVDLADEVVLGALELPNGTAIRKVARAEGGSRWYLGGPNPEELITWTLE